MRKKERGSKPGPVFGKSCSWTQIFWAWYDLACLDALDHKPAAAFHNLYKSIECGFKDVDYLLRDSDFKSIREDPRWRAVLDCIADSTKSGENPVALRP